jgi:hypothetical protein
MSLNQYTGTSRDLSNQSLVTAAGQVKREKSRYGKADVNNASLQGVMA